MKPKTANMKILILEVYYPEFLDDFYAKNPNMSDLSYAGQKAALLGECFGTGGFCSENLKKLGHITGEIIFGAEHLEKAWAKEHGIKRGGLFLHIPKIRSWRKSKLQADVLESQVKSFNPDVIYCYNLKIPAPKIMRKLKKHTRLLVGQVACPTDFVKKRLEHFDLIFTSFPHFVKKFTDIGIRAEYLKMAFEPDILPKITKKEKRYDAVFIGGFSKHHADIMETFEYLAENTNIDFWGYGKSNLPPESAIRAKHHGPAWGLEMYNILASSKISVNRHIGVAENYANNMRLYESTGVGAMLITDMKDNLGELFEIGKEIETYETKEELSDKIKYYLAHDAEREKIARAGQVRTLREHTYELRMKTTDEVLRRFLSD